MQHAGSVKQDNGKALVLSICLILKRGLILCLIYRAVYLNVIKDFSPRKGAKLFDVSIIAPLENQKKKNPDSEAPLCLKQKDVKEIRLVVVEELRKSLGV